MSAEGQDKIYSLVTERIIESLEKGTVPWRKPWNAAMRMPLSMSSRKYYRGVNVWLLALEAEDRGFTSPWWGTSKHIKELGGTIKADEWKRATVIVFWKRLIVKDDKADNGKRTIYLLRYYRVYNADQADGLPERYYPKPGQPVEAESTVEDAEVIIKGYLANGGPKLRKVMGDRADYAGVTDTITMPKDEQFTSSAGRYDATFHELGHSTGHKSRLNRPGIVEFDHFGSGQYAKEELVAQMTAAMLDAIAGVEADIENSAAYVANWLKALKSDNKLVIQASAQAQRAADHIRGVKFETVEAE